MSDASKIDDGGAVTYQVEIFERSTGKAVEVQNCEDLSAFRRYWNKQANTAEFGFRVLAGSDKSPQRHVARVSLTSDVTTVLPLTDDLIAEIAKYNGYLSAAEVYAALMDGKNVYTNFNRYVLEA